MCGGFSIWRSAHFNLVVRRKRFELVFHADTDTDIHCTQRVEYSLLRVLDTRYSLSFADPSQAGCPSCPSRFLLISWLQSHLAPPALNFCARFLIFWRVFHLFGVFFLAFIFVFLLRPLAQLARSWT